MSYCVNCGVELNATASFCPLCHTPVVNPNQPVDLHSLPPYPIERKEVAPVPRGHLAILLTTVLLSVAVCCGVLNRFLSTNHLWSLYVIGAAVMLWIWIVPPLLLRKPGAFRLQMLADIVSVAAYVSLVAIDLDSWEWYWHLALPIILWLGALFLFWGLTLGRRQRSLITSATLVVGSLGVFAMGVEHFTDLFFHGRWSPSWSLIVLAVCIVLMVPLLVIRHVPSLREEVRRRFHL